MRVFNAKLERKASISLKTDLLIPAYMFILNAFKAAVLLNSLCCAMQTDFIGETLDSHGGEYKYEFWSVVLCVW
jgi:hypothetical protein